MENHKKLFSFEIEQKKGGLPIDLIEFLCLTFKKIFLLNHVVFIKLACQIQHDIARIFFLNVSLSRFFVLI